MAEILMITGMFAVTFSVRYLLWGTAGRIHFPDWLSKALAFVPPAVLTAIIVPAVLINNRSEINFSLHNPYLIAAIAAFALSLWRQNLLLTISFGMFFFMLLKWGIGLN